MPALAQDVALPFRWDLVSPDNLGTLLDGAKAPSPWYLPELIECTGKVLARSADGDLYFVGRSLDSMFDLLSGALPDRVHRLPLSLSGRVTYPHRMRARAFLASVGITPHALARRRRPVTFVDVVHSGSTFTGLFFLLHEWISNTGEPWPVVRRKLRFVGVTSREPSSPRTFRWQQHAPWTRLLPTSSVVNVSLDRFVWSYFGDSQVKLTRSFRPPSWFEEPDGPARGERLASALAEALALVRTGRSPEGRALLARAMDASHGPPWLRSLALHLKSS